MSKPFAIKILTDVADFLRGTRNVGAALDEVADSLDEMTADAQRAARASGASLTDMGADLGRVERQADGAASALRGIDSAAGALGGVEQHAEGATRAMRDMETAGQASLEGIEVRADTTGRAIGADLDAGTDKASAGVDRLEATFKQAYDDIQDRAKKTGDRVAKESKDSTRHAIDYTGEFKDEAVSNFSEVASSFTGDMDSAVDMVQGTLGGLASALGPAGLVVGGVGAAAGAFYTQWKEKAEATEERISAMYEDMTESGQAYLSGQFIQEEMNKIMTSADDARISYEDLTKVAKDMGISTSLALRAFAGEQTAVNLVMGTAKTRQEEYWKSVDTSAVVMNDAAGAIGAAAGKALSAWDQDTMRGVIEKLEAITSETGSAASKTKVYRDALGDLPDELRTELGVDANGREIDAASKRLDKAAKDRTSEIDAKAETARADRDLDKTASESRTAKLGAKADTARADRDLDQAAADRRADITAKASTRDADRALDRAATDRRADITARAYGTSDADRALDRVAGTREAWIRARVDTLGAGRTLSEFLGQPRNIYVQPRIGKYAP